jgi:regulatory protein
MIITDIIVCKKNKNRVNIYVDGQFAFALFAETAVRAGLRKDMDVSGLDLSKIGEEEEKKFAMDAALSLIAYRMRSKKEVLDKLKQKDVAPETADLTVEKLEELGYLNDRNYAAAYAEELKDRMGKRGIRQKLFEKGVDRVIIDETLNSLGDFSEVIRAQAERLFQKNGDADEYKTVQKVIRTLLNRGFELDEIKTAISGIAEE